MCEERQVTLRKWKKRLSRSSKGEWSCLLIHDLEAWLKRDLGQMNFNLTRDMPGHGAFNPYLFNMKLDESSNAPTVIEEGEMIMTGIPCLSASISTVLGGHHGHHIKEG